MPDGTVINPGTGGDTIADDEITDGGVANGQKVQRMKTGFGPDSGYTDVDQTHGLPSSLIPAPYGGWTPHINAALGTTVDQVKGSAGRLGGYVLFNPNGGPAYLQVFNAAAAGVTVGTTAPSVVIPVPGGGCEKTEFACGIEHTTAISVAATSTATGALPPAQPLIATVLFK